MSYFGFEEPHRAGECIRCGGDVLIVGTWPRPQCKKCGHMGSPKPHGNAFSLALHEEIDKRETIARVERERQRELELLHERNYDRKARRWLRSEKRL